MRVAWSRHEMEKWGIRHNTEMACILIIGRGAAPEGNMLNLLPPKKQKNKKKLLGYYDLHDPMLILNKNLFF